MSDAAAAATTAPDPARIHAAVRRSPGKRSRPRRPRRAPPAPPRARSRPIEPSRRPPPAPLRRLPRPRRAPPPPTVGRRRAPRRRPRAAERPPRRRRAERGSCPPGEPRPRRLAQIPLNKRHAIRRLELLGQLRPQHLGGRRKDDSDVADRHRDGVAIALEDRAVHVAGRGPEQPRERAAADDAGGHGLDQRAGRDQVALVLQHHPVGQLFGDQRAHAVVLERRRSPGSRTGPSRRRPAHVSGYQGQRQKQAGGRHERPHGQPAHPSGPGDLWFGGGHGTTISRPGVLTPAGARPAAAPGARSAPPAPP